MISGYAEARAHIASADRIGYAMALLLEFWTGTADTVTPQTCEAYRRWRGKADSTARRELGILQAALHHAHRLGRMTRPVFAELPPPATPRDRWMTRSKVARLIRAARLDRRSDHLVTFIMVALYTGGRKTTVLELRWPAVDFHAGLISLERDDQTGKPRAIVPTPRPLLLYLTAIRLHHGPTGFVVSYFGKPVKDVKKGFQAAANRAGLVAVSPHILRHTGATWQARAGVGPRDVGAWLGHRDLRTTQKYAHHAPDFLARNKKAMER